MSGGSWRRRNKRSKKGERWRCGVKEQKKERSKEGTNNERKKAKKEEVFKKEGRRRI